MSSILDNLKALAGAALLPIVKSIGEAELVVALDGLDAKEGDVNFATDLKAGYNLFKRLDASLKAGGFAEGLISAILEALQTEATKHNITLV